MQRFTAFLMTIALAFPAGAELAGDDATAAFVAGLRAYEARDYAGAAALLEEVIVLEPGCARCAHLLGKSYGRLAEQAGGVTALGFARKTRDALEQAVALDPDDPEAVGDLIKYYRTAPAFLGGSNDKADALEQHLRRAESDHSG